MGAGRPYPSTAAPGAQLSREPGPTTDVLQGDPRRVRSRPLSGYPRGETLPGLGWDRFDIHPCGSVVDEGLLAPVGRYQGHRGGPGLPSRSVDGLHPQLPSG